MKEIYDLNISYNNIDKSPMGIYKINMRYFDCSNNKILKLSEEN